MKEKKKKGGARVFICILHYTTPFEAIFCDSSTLPSSHFKLTLPLPFIPVIPILQSYFEHETHRCRLKLQKAQASSKSSSFYSLRVEHQLLSFFSAYLTFVLEYHQTQWFSIPILSKTLHVLDFSLILTGFPLLSTRSKKCLTLIHSSLPPLTLCETDSLKLFKPIQPTYTSPTLFPPVYESVHFPFHFFLNHIKEQNESSSSSGSSLYPFLIRQGCLDWPACKKWDLKYLITQAGYRFVPIELGFTYLDKDWKLKYMTLHHYIQHYILNSSGFGVNSESKSDMKHTLGYLAQYDLFQQLPELMKDIGPLDLLLMIDSLTRSQTQSNIHTTNNTNNHHHHPKILEPIYCKRGKKPTKEKEEENQEKDFSLLNLQKHIWLGPKNTITPFHHDGPLHNVFTQIRGRKKIILVPPSYQTEMDPMSNDVQLKNTSQIDLDHWDTHRIHEWITQENIQGLECIIEEGDVLYIPPGWWHYVKSLTASISVSFWW